MENRKIDLSNYGKLGEQIADALTKFNNITMKINEQVDYIALLSTILDSTEIEFVHKLQIISALINSTLDFRTALLPYHK